MVSEIVRQGRAAWARLKRESGSRGRDQRTWGDWLLVGRALLEGREIAMRQTRPRVEGRVYWPALNAWLHDNRFNLSRADRASLFAVMAELPAIEAWRATLPETQRLRLNHPGTVLRNYRKAIGAGAASECSQPTAPASP